MNINKYSYLDSNTHYQQWCRRTGTVRNAVPVLVI